MLIRVVICLVLTTLSFTSYAKTQKNQFALEMAIKDCDAAGFDLIVPLGQYDVDANNPTSSDYLNKSPLRLAVNAYYNEWRESRIQGCLHIIDSLLEQGANPLVGNYNDLGGLGVGGPRNQKFDGALYDLLGRTDSDRFFSALELFIKHGAIDYRNGIKLRVLNEKNILKYSSTNSQGNEAIRRKLAKLTSQPTLLMLLSWYCVDNVGNGMVVFEKVLKDSNVNAQDKSGQTALMYATWNSGTGPARLLLEHGADPSIRDIGGKTAMDYALEYGKVEIAKLIQSYNPRATQTTTESKPEIGSGISNGRGGNTYEGVYFGTYDGADAGTFQVSISQDGVAKLRGKSSKSGGTFTGDGKVSPDGSITVGSASTGSTFTGAINASGVLSGSWNNTAYNQSGSFRGNKGEAGKANPLETIGGVLNGLGKLLGQ